ncbi:EamA family transporter RarD [Amphritea japonica]|uniref:Chloramphenicol-sensitive protein RarD n=1 Tax=Amphritea japonica ATCC BAA-1530 TaxID=1278309 RepID=A0A7R6P4P8_9GAMM|nr:EamA family transporter RarD [Amphritea japonica]BBB25869.1 chloramphenicol-sensitive protein RarD [Amphritea japonica ATCC BAA-1530]
MRRFNLPQNGLLWTTSAYIVWGLTPLFYQHLRGVEAMEIFALRVLCSVPLMLVLLWVTATPFRVLKMLMVPRTFFWLFLSTACISISWYLNTWGATNGQVLMVSLAYFLTPLISILIGVIYLRERLNSLQWLALLLCACGFLYACMSLESFPWITIGIACAFGCYGVIKKQVRIDTLNGLTAETLLMVPFALFYLVSMVGQTHWESDVDNVRIFLVMTAPMTIVPLGLFAFGVARINNLSTIAVLQYIEPTLYFLLAVFVFGEAMDMERLTTFLLVWAGFIIFSIDATRRAKLAKLVGPKKLDI